MLNGSSDVDEEVLTRAGLANLDSTRRCISQAVYVGIADDLKVQLHDVRGVVAKRPPNPQQEPEPESHPFPSPLLGGFGLNHPAMPWGSVSEGVDGSLPQVFGALAGMAALAGFGVQYSAARHIEQRNPQRLRLDRWIPDLTLREEGLRDVDREALRQAARSKSRSRTHATRSHRCRHRESVCCRDCCKIRAPSPGRHRRDGRARDQSPGLTKTRRPGLASGLPARMPPPAHRLDQPDRRQLLIHLQLHQRAPRAQRR